MRTAIIDGDSISYLCSKDTLDESQANVDSILATILEETGSTHYYLFLSKGPYFRHSINTKYKDRPKPEMKFLVELKDYLIEKYQGVFYDNVEADDMVAFVASTVIKGDYVISSIDKDVIGQVPGKYFNYKTHQLGETTYHEATKFCYLQALMGDSVDKITGIPGVGKVKALKVLNNVHRHEYKFAVLGKYVEHYGGSSGIYNFQKNFRQVYLLRSEEDFINEVGYIPEVGEPIKATNE